jgi:hypothetical protein
MELQKRLHIRTKPICDGLKMSNSSAASNDRDPFAVVLNSIEQLGEIPRGVSGTNFRHEIMIIRFWCSNPLEMQPNETGGCLAERRSCQRDGLRGRRKHGGSGVSGRLQKQWQLHGVQHPHHSVPDVMRDHTLDVVLTQEPGNASVVLG